MVLMAQGGEFAFVLYSAAMAVGLITQGENAVLTAIIILSMALTPLFILAHDRLMPKPVLSAEGLPTPEDDGDVVLLIGFGRFGQVVSQPLLAMGHRVSIIDTDTEMITTAQSLGFKVYFGDGTRLDILRAAGATHARAVVIAVDNPGAATRIAHLLHDTCPLVPVFARAFDRRHAMDLIKAGALEPTRETFESALAMGADVMRRLGAGDNMIADTIADARRRDAERFALQMVGDVTSGRNLMLSNVGIAMENSG
jgi:glutathione-regulated potassium-efflux system protein KefB